MHNKTTENWSKACQCAGKPMIELAELNAKSINKMAEQARTLHDAIQTRRPEDFISANMNAMTTGSAMLAEYNRKASEIMVNSMTEAGKLWSDILQDSASHVSGSMASTGKSNSGENTSRQK